MHTSIKLGILLTILPYLALANAQNEYENHTQKAWTGAKCFVAARIVRKAWPWIGALKLYASVKSSKKMSYDLINSVKKNNPWAYSYRNNKHTFFRKHLTFGQRCKSAAAFGTLCWGGCSFLLNNVSALIATPISWGAAGYTGYHLYEANEQEKSRLIQEEEDKNKSWFSFIKNPFETQDKNRIIEG